MDREPLIDDVARELTGTGRRAVMRTRVLSAIEHEPQTGSHRTPRVAIAAAAVIACAIAVANVIVERQTDVTAPAPVSSGARVQSPVVSTDRSIGTAGGRVTPGPASASVAVLARQQTAAARQTAAPTAEELVWLARAVVPLSDPAPLMVSDVQPSALEIPLLEVTPLGTEPLDVAPLSIDPVAGGG